MTQTETQTPAVFMVTWTTRSFKGEPWEQRRFFSTEAKAQAFVREQEDVPGQFFFDVEECEVD